MPVAPARRFSLFDAMILVAATAIGMFLLRLTGVDWPMPAQATGRVRSFIVLQVARQVIVPFLASWTIALLILRIRRPGPRLRLALREPGAIACAAATVAIAAEVVWICGLLAAGSRIIHPGVVFAGYAQQVSFAVLGGWTGLAVSGRWRAESSWIDRAGRAVGAAWIVVTTVHFGSYFLDI